MTAGETYQNVNDSSVIEYVETISTYMKYNSKTKRNELKRFSDPKMIFIYTESDTKKGKQAEFKESEWERLVKQNMFVKI